MRAAKLFLAALVFAAGLLSLATDSPAAGNPPGRCAPPLAEVGWIAGGDPVDGYAVILHTIDGGATWTRQGSADSLPNVGLVNIHAVDDCTAWTVGDRADGYGTILKTTDGGATWVRQGDAAQIPDLELIGVYALDRQTVWVSGDQGVIFKTTDGGATWTRQGADVAPPVQLSGIYAADANNVWVVGSDYGGCGAILHTADGGASWVRQVYTPRPEVSSPYLITCHGCDAQTVWAVGRNTALMTTDGGATWQDVTMSGGLGGYDLNGIYVVNRDTAWLATDNDGIFRYDSGVWTQQQPPVHGYYLLRVTGLGADRIWMAGSRYSWDVPPGVILHTATGDEPWTSQTPPVETDLWGVTFVRSLPPHR